VSVSAATLAAVLLGGALAGCSSGSSRSSAPAPRPDATARASHVQRLASIGDVIVRREGRKGVVIRDRATRGKRFFLTGMQAGECLSYLKANPGASAKDVRAACPGEAVAATKTTPGQG
jgi:photosystem II stability/assembly factor-like uncharacterized protein